MRAAKPSNSRMKETEGNPFKTGIWTRGPEELGFAYFADFCGLFAGITRGATCLINSDRQESTVQSPPALAVACSTLSCFSAATCGSTRCLITLHSSTIRMILLKCLFRALLLNLCVHLAALATNCGSKCKSSKN